MAAGVIYQTVTTTSGETVELGFYVDETGAPTTWTNETHLAAGTNAIGKLAANSGVDIGDVDVTSVIPGTGATNLGKAIDTATGATDTGVLMLATRDDTLGALTPAEGDNVQLRVDSTGALHTVVSTVGDITATVTVDNAGTFATQDADVLAAIEGTVAHDAPDSGNGSKISAVATASLAGATLVSAADRTDLYAGIDGVQITRPYCNLEDIISGVSSSITDGSSTSVIASQGAGVKSYITTCIISNDSDTNVTVDIRDGAAGTVKATIPVPAVTSGIDGFVHSFPVPLAFSAATAVCADPSAATSNGGIVVTLIGFKSKV
jgi:hypothetical protein